MGIKFELGFFDLFLAFLIALLFLSACSLTDNPRPLPVAIQQEGIGVVVQKDIENGITIGTASLGAADNLVACYTALDATIKALVSAQGANGTDAYVFSDIMKTRIIQQLISSNTSLSQQACAGFSNEILIAIATRGRNLLPSIPTGAPVPAPGLSPPVK